MAGTNWKLGKGDFVQLRGLSTMEGMFNHLVLVFTTPDGEERHVEVTDPDTAAKYGVLNAGKVPTTHGTNRWTAASVRKAFVS